MSTRRPGCLCFWHRTVRFELPRLAWRLQFERLTTNSTVRSPDGELRLGAVPADIRLGAGQFVFLATIGFKHWVFLGLGALRRRSADGSSVTLVTLVTVFPG